MALMDEVGGFWTRSFRALRSAGLLLEDEDYDSAVSESYYAAFYAVKALFLLEERAFKTHRALDRAVNLDLVRTRRWPKSLAVLYREMMKDRNLADYESLSQFTKRQAEAAIKSAWKVVRAVQETRSDMFVILKES